MVYRFSLLSLGILLSCVGFANDPVKLIVGEADGKIRPLLGVNVGPIMVGMRGKSDFTDEYRRIGVTQVRTHDFYGPLDMATMYPDQEADPSLESSYDFSTSDRYFRAILNGGFEPYLRIGDSWRNAPQFPEAKPRAPRNRANWARAAVEVVRHYQKMAGGRLRYVEIWNEPDHKQFWDSSIREFGVLFDQTVRAVKKEFPGLKVGGPGFAPGAVLIPMARRETRAFLNYLSERHTPIDFLSWHIYANDPESYLNAAEFVRRELDSRGFRQVTSHITEYNTSDNRLSRGITAADMRMGGRGAAVLGAAWIVMQRQGIEQAHFYRGMDMSMDQPTFYGLFRANGAPKRSAHVFFLWSRMARHSEMLKVSVPESVEDRLWVLAGRNPSNGATALLISNLSDSELPWEIQVSGGIQDQNMRIEEVSNAARSIVGRNADGNSASIPGHAVQLVVVARPRS